MQLSLAISFYEQMAHACSEGYPYLKKQPCKDWVMDLIYLEVSSLPELYSSIIKLNAAERRIPQEVLSYEKLVRLAYL